MSHSGLQQRCLVIIGCMLLAACATAPRLKRGGNVVLPSSQGAAGVIANLAASCASLVLADSGRAGICSTTRADTAFGPITSAGPGRRWP